MSDQTREQLVPSVSEDEWNLLRCSIRALDTGANHCRYCRQQAGCGAHDEGCVYIKSIFDAEVARALVDRIRTALASARQRQRELEQVAKDEELIYRIVTAVIEANTAAQGCNAVREILRAALARVEQEIAHETRSPDGDGLGRGDSGSNPDRGCPRLAQVRSEPPQDATEMLHEAHVAAPCKRAGSEPAESQPSPPAARLDLDDEFTVLHNAAMALAYDDANEWTCGCFKEGYKANLLAMRIEELVERLRSPGAGEARLRELARETARRVHIDYRADDDYGIGGHDEDFDACSHPDCVLVRAGLVSGQEQT